MSTRLLRRLGGPRDAPGPAGLLASVQSILDTHLGESLSSPALGVLDFADVVHRTGAGAQALAHSIRAALTRHEPRLRGVVVQLAGAGPLCLAFEISAHLAGQPREPLRARVDLSPSGHLHLRT